MMDTHLIEKRERKKKMVGFAVCVCVMTRFICMSGPGVWLDCHENRALASRKSVWNQLTTSRLFLVE